MGTAGGLLVLDCLPVVVSDLNSSGAESSTDDDYGTSIRRVRARQKDPVTLIYICSKKVVISS